MSEIKIVAELLQMIIIYVSRRNLISTISMINEKAFTNRQGISILRNSLPLLIIEMS
jgi:hypothetical protein